MKLRILGNSIRLRIQKGELAMLGEQGSIQETIQFSTNPENTLVYAVHCADEINDVSVAYESNCISIQVPRVVVMELLQTDRVGISQAKSLDDNTTLSILIEKDFKCLTPREEDKDAFPHPDQESGHTNCS